MAEKPVVIAIAAEAVSGYAREAVAIFAGDILVCICNYKIRSFEGDVYTA